MSLSLRSLWTKIQEFGEHPRLVEDAGRSGDSQPHEPKVVAESTGSALRALWTKVQSLGDHPRVLVELSVSREDPSLYPTTDLRPFVEVHSSDSFSLREARQRIDAFRQKRRDERGSNENQR